MSTHCVLECVSGRTIRERSGSVKIVFILANSADPDEMQHYAAFHLGL